LETTTPDFVVAVPVADIRHDPDENAEMVTQALMNVPVSVGDVSGEWTYVTLADYAGWIRTVALEVPVVRGYCEGGEGTCGVPLPYSVVVTVPHAPLYRSAESDEQIDELYLSTALPYIDLSHPKRLHVALPGEREGWLERTMVDVRSNTEVYPLQDIGVVTSYAKEFLDRPYLWGGTSWRGIDCSGFVQLCYRMGGNTIPRDADQQHDFLAQSVRCEEMQEGDLIFFGSKRITHVGLALSNSEYIHAEGSHFHHVIRHSFNPNAANYYEKLDKLVWGIKRVR
jgi:hypothetical protein